MSLRIVPLLLLALASPVLANDVPYLVRDLPGLTVHDSMPFGRAFWASSGNTTWFIAATASKSIEIFKTDGTAAGTLQVTHGTGTPESRFLGPFLGLVRGKLVYGGRDAGGEGVFALDTNGGDPVLLGRFALVNLTNGVVRGDTLYFSGRTAKDPELWRTDGTPAGTSKTDLLAADQSALSGTLSDVYLFAAGRWIFFFGITPRGTGLQRTDGTAANTALVLPLSATALVNDPLRAAALGERLLVRLNDGLWASDGTAEGTSRVAAVQDFLPLDVAGGKLYFVSGGELWITDASAAGTQRIDLPSGTNAIIGPGRGVGNRFFFVADAKLYVTEGTTASTRAIAPVDQRSSFFLGEGFAIGNFFYFRNDDGVHGMELWRSDGTTTEMVADINPSYRDGLDSALGFTRPDGTVLFAARTFDTGREPWITDGTAAGTHLLKNVAEEDFVSGSSPHSLQANGDHLFFVAELAAGQAIGVSDGTNDGTTATVVDFSATMFNPVSAHGRYFFNASNRLYVSDGTAAGTTPIYQPGVTPYALPNGVLFVDNGDLWFSDGTLGGTRKVRSFGPLSRLRIAPSGDFAWLTASSRLWTTDGSEAGTTEIVPTPAPTGEISEFIRAGSLTYFVESNRLWRSDGTSAGTSMVKDLGPPQYPTEFVGATPRLVYFNLNQKLSVSDGTDGGTIALPVDTPCIASGAVVGDALLFTSLASNGTLTVWRSNGTAAGTTALATMRPPGSASPGCRTLTARGNAVYFSGWDAAHGWELWTSDGTAVGTKMLADIYPGTKSSLPGELTVAGDRLFFSADSPNIGRELWALGGHLTARRRASRP